MTTMADVARHAGVSASTVSYAISGKRPIAQETRDRIEQAIAELGFAPNGMASSLARGVTRTVGLVVIDLSNTLFVDMAMGAQREAHAHGYYLQLAASDDDRSLFDAHMRQLNSSRVAGILAAPMEDHREAIAKLRRHGSPVVLMNYDMGDFDACRVLVDNELAARSVVDIDEVRLVEVR